MAATKTKVAPQAYVRNEQVITHWSIGTPFKVHSIRLLQAKFSSGSTKDHLASAMSELAKEGQDRHVACTLAVVDGDIWSTYGMWPAAWLCTSRGEITQIERHAVRAATQGRKRCEHSVRCRVLPSVRYRHACIQPIS